MRKLTVSYCPECLFPIALLKEKRISDGRLFSEYISGYKVFKKIKIEKKNILYVKYGQSKKVKDDWTFGINKEIKNRKGEIVEIRQYASNFKGKKELIRKYEVNGKRVQ